MAAGLIGGQGMGTMPEQVSFDRIADCYDATRVVPPNQQGKIARGIMAAVGAGPGTRFVEPGVGTGRIALPLLRQGVDYVGTDIAPQMLDRLRTKLAEEPGISGRIELMVADAAKLPLPDASFDVALTAHLLHLLPDWRRALDELRRVVKPGGCYVQATNDVGGAIVAFKAELRRLATRRGVDLAPRRIIGPGDIRVYFRLAPAAEAEPVLARWTTRRPVGDVLRSYREREFSWLWSLGDADHAALVAELEAWAMATYRSAETILDEETSFRIAVIRFEP